MAAITRRNVGIALSILTVLFIFYYFTDVVTWLSIAWIVSMLGSPIMKLLGKLKIGKWQISSGIRAVIVLGLFYCVFGLFLYIFVPVIIQQGRNLAGVNYAAIMQSLEEPLSHASDWLIENGLMEGKLSKYSHTNAPDSSQKDSTLVVIDSSQLVPIDTTSNIVNDSTNGVLNNDTLNLNLVSNDTNTTNILLNMDSMLASHGQGNKKTDIQLHIQISLDKTAQQTASNTEEEHHDSTAIVQPTDTPFESLKKRVFSFINPGRILTQTAGYAINFFGNFILLISSVSFIAFFFLKDEELFARGIKAAIPDEYMDRVDATLAGIRYMLTRYFGGILLQITVITLYVSIFLFILGIENGLLIGFFAAIINVIPYLGPILGAIFGLVVTLSSHLDVSFYGEMLPMLVWVCIVFATMQLLDNFILQPIIFSNSVLAHPLEIFIVVIAGAKLGGITGMVVAIPIYTIFRVIAASFLSGFKIVQQLTQQLNETDSGINNNNNTNANSTPPPTNPLP